MHGGGLARADRRFTRRRADRTIHRTICGLRESLGDWLLTVLTGLLLIMMFVIAPLQAMFDGGFSYFAAGVALPMIAGALILSGSLFVLLLMASAFALNVVVVINRFHGVHGEYDLHLLAVSWLVLSITLGVVVARAVFANGRVSYHRIVGAILLYILIALVFVALYLIVGLSAPDAFKNMVFDDAPELTSQLIYFSCSTLTTLGYGDIVPISPFARSLANLEAFFGQLYPAILIGRLVTLQMQERE
jgi:voltage-gated potassium channel Kch